MLLQVTNIISQIIMEIQHLMKFKETLKLENV